MEQVDKVLLPALSGVVKTYILTLQRYENKVEIAK